MTKGKVAMLVTLCAALLSLNLVAASTWQKGEYDPTTWTPSEKNLLLGNNGTFNGSHYKGDQQGKKPCVDTMMVLTDGYLYKKDNVDLTYYQADCTVASSGTTMTWDFYGSCDLESVRIFSFWGDKARASITITKVEVQVEGSAAWVEIGGAVDYKGTTGREYAFLVNDEGGNLAENVTKLCLTFGAQQNTGCGFCEIEAVGEMKVIPPQSGVAWTVKPYTDLNWTPAENNLLAGNKGTFEGTLYEKDSKGSLRNDMEVITDGNVAGNKYDVDFGVATAGSTMTWDLGRSCNLDSINVFSYWEGGGRDGISIGKVEVMKFGETEWTDVRAPAVIYGVMAVDDPGNTSSSGRLKATLTNGEEALAEEIVAIRLTFDTQDNNGTGYCEIEAIGTYNEVPTFEVASSVSEGGYGTPSMAYGSHFNLSAGEIALTMSDPIHVKADSGEVYECTGWTYTDGDSVLATGEGVSAKVPYEGGYRKFTWKWEVVGHTVNIVHADTGRGTVVLSQAKYGANGYDDGDTVTVTCTPAAGNASFRWFGDVPAGHETDMQLTVTVNAALTLIPTFDWVYDSSANTICDGYWTLNTTLSDGDKLSVKAIKSTAVDGATYLDLRKPVDGGYAIVSIDGSAFKGNTVLNEVYLPETLKSIGGYSFQGCTSLEKVEPLLPDSVSYVGMNAFMNCSKLTGSLRYGYSTEPATFSADANNNTYVFNGTAITNIDLGPALAKIIPSLAFKGNKSLKHVSLANATGITDIGWNAFEDCTSLGEVELPSSLAYIGAYAFQNCTSLTNVVPFLPDSVNSIGIYAFNGCSKLAGDLRLGFADSMAFSVNNGWQTHQFNGTKIATVTLGPAVTNIPTAVFSGAGDNLKAVYWHRISDEMSFDKGAFPSSKALSFCHFIPRGDDNWKQYIENNCVTDELTDAEIEAFKAAYPKVKQVAGKIKLPSEAANFQYYSYWNPTPTGTMIIVR